MVQFTKFIHYVLWVGNFLFVGEKRNYIFIFTPIKATIFVLTGSN